MKVFDENFVLKSSFQAHTQYVNRIKQSPYDANYVATASWDNSAKIWQILNDTWSLTRTYTGHTMGVFGLEFIDIDTVASGSENGIIHTWSISTGLTNLTINTGQWVVSLQMLSDGIHLVAGMLPSINIYDVKTGSLVTTLKGHTSWVEDLVLLSGEDNNNLMASSSADSTVRIWDLSTYTCKFTLKGHTGQIFGLKQVSSEILSSGADDNLIKLWNITTGLEITTLKAGGRIDWSIDLLSDGKTLVSGSWDTTIRLWDIQTGASLKIINTGLQIRSLTVLNKKSSTKSKLIILK